MNPVISVALPAILTSLPTIFLFKEFLTIMDSVMYFEA